MSDLFRTPRTSLPCAPGCSFHRALRPVLALAPPVQGRRRREAERPGHPQRRRRLGRVWLPGGQGHPDAEHRLDRQERRPVHAGLRLRPVLQPDPRGPDDGPLSDPVRPRVQRRRRRQRPAPDRDDDRRPAPGPGLRHLRHRQVAPGRQAASSGPRSAGSTSSSARWPTRPIITPPSSSTRAISDDVRPVTDDDFYTTDAYADRAVDWIGKHKDRPWFLYLPFNAQHAPLQAPQKYLDRFPNIEDEKRKLFAAMMSAMDDAVGRVLAKVRELGQEENTLIVFLSDNGGPTRRRRRATARSAASRRRPGKGASACPFCMQWKGTLPAGKTYEHPIIQLDILPTALAAAGAQGRPGVEARRRRPAAVPDRRATPTSRTRRSTGGSASSGPSATATGSSWSAGAAAAGPSCTTWPRTSARRPTSPRRTPRSARSCRGSTTAGTPSRPRRSPRWRTPTRAAAKKAAEEGGREEGPRTFDSRRKRILGDGHSAMGWSASWCQCLPHGLGDPFPRPDRLEGRNPDGSEKGGMSLA